MSALQAFDCLHNGVVLNGQLARPSGPGPHPGVLVMGSARGLGPQTRARALNLAESGYVAVATDMYGGGTFFDNPRDAGGPLIEMRDDPGLLRGRVTAWLDALRGISDVDSARLAAIGFCFGGQCVLELARSGADIAAVVSFHGLLATEMPASAGEVTAKVLALTGALDPYVPPEHVQGFRDEMTDAGVDWQLTVYGQGSHAFTGPPEESIADIPGVRYDELLDRLSWAQATTFLAAVLGK